MRLNGRVLPAVALAVFVACGGSLPPPATAPAPPDPAGPAPAARGVVDAQAPTPTAALSGIVVDADTRRPLARARVTLTSPALAQPRVAITGTDGTYTFTHLPAGMYSVSATRTGFAPRHPDQRRSPPPPDVSVAAGQQVGGVEVALSPAGVIAGQILDEDNQPFAGARVAALVLHTEDGQPTLVPLAVAESDDHGAFRLNGLPAGQYYVSAFDPAFAGVGDDTGALTYTATYYPGTPHLEKASRVTVVPGVQPTTKVVFALRIIRPARVSGTLSTLDRRRLTSGAVILSPLRGEGAAPIPAQDVSILPEGTFAFRNVPPGRYQIRARGEVDPQGTALFATYTVTVDGRDLDGLSMTLTPAATIEGRLAVDASSRPPSFAGVRVRAPSAAGGSAVDTLRGDVAPDGAFRIPGVLPGRHYIGVEGLPAPWVLKRVLHRGRDVTDIAIDIEGRQHLKDLEVVVTDRASDVSGTVQDDHGREAAAALVLVIPSSPQLWTPMSRRLRTTRTDGKGGYRVRGLPAGQYNLLATYALDESDAYRRDLLQDLVAQATPLDLGDGARRTLDLRVVAIAPRQTSSR